MDILQINQFTTIIIIIIIIQVIWDVTYCIVTNPLRPSNPGRYVCEKITYDSSERITTIFNIQVVCDIAYNIARSSGKNTAACGVENQTVSEVIRVFSLTTKHHGFTMRGNDLLRRPHICTPFSSSSGFPTEAGDGLW